MSDVLLVEAVATLGAWPAPDPGQAALRDDYLAHLATVPDGLWRDGPPSHLTASCFVLDAAAEHVLLVLHGKGRFWVQPGGHLERGDRSLAAAALREAAEETGLDLDATALPHEGPVDLHRHGLGAAFGRCAEHLDVAFAAVAPTAASVRVSDESLDVRWFPVDALPADAVPDLADRLPRAVSTLRGLRGPGAAARATTQDAAGGAPS